MPQIWKELSSPLVSLFNVMSNCKISLFLLPNVKEKQKTKKSKHLAT
jgi:hypothetical protein